MMGADNCANCGVSRQDHKIKYRFRTIDELIKRGMDPEKIDRSRPDLENKIGCARCTNSFNNKGVSKLVY